MRSGSVHEVRRDRTASGLDYVLASDGEPAFAWTLHPYHLGDDVVVRRPDGEPVLRITADDVVEYVDADFAVLDERDGSVVGFVR